MLTPSIVRVFTGIIVGFILNLPATPAVLDLLNITTDQASAYIGGGVTAILAGLYYAVVRILEEKKSDGWGWLLGLANRPQYTAPASKSVLPEDRTF